MPPRFRVRSHSTSRSDPMDGRTTLCWRVGLASDSMKWRPRPSPTGPLHRGKGTVYRFPSRHPSKSISSLCRGANGQDRIACTRVAGDAIVVQHAGIRGRLHQTQHHGRRTATTNVPLGPGNVFTPTGGYLSVVNMPLWALIGFAYKITGDQEQYLRPRLADWVLTERYNVEARAAGNPAKDEMRLMVRSLLAERCKLAVHYETRQAPVVAMVLAKAGENGPALSAASRRAGVLHRSRLGETHVRRRFPVALRRTAALAARPWPHRQVRSEQCDAAVHRQSAEHHGATGPRGGRPNGIER